MYVFTYVIIVSHSVDDETGIDVDVASVLKDDKTGMSTNGTAVKTSDVCIGDSNKVVKNKIVCKYVMVNYDADLMIT